MLCHGSMKTEGKWSLSVHYQGEFPVQIVKFTYTKNEFNQPSPPPLFVEVVSKDRLKIIDSELAAGQCEISNTNQYFRVSE